MRLPAAFERYRVAIDARLREELDGHDLPLYTMMRYHLGWVDACNRPTGQGAGKALRPTLCLLSCETVGGEFHAALPAAAAVEAMHNFSLIHDDIQDQDVERRHRPTVWRVWGEAQAINAGTAMQVLSVLALAGSRPAYLSADTQLEAVRLLERACLQLIEGQYLDISFEGRMDVTVDEYLEMIGKKTAALIECSMQLGALTGGAGPDLVSRLQRCGRNLGYAFQVRDDILGMWGDEARTGKPRGADIRRRKKSFPVVYSLQKARVEGQTALRDIYAQSEPDEGAVEQALRLMAAAGAREEAQRLVEHYHQQALAELREPGLAPQGTQDLAEVALFLAAREF